MKIASRKKAQPSMPNPSPKTSPKRPIMRGQRMPNSKESTVPVTAPTANCTAMTTDQRRASLRATGSLRRSPMPSMTTVMKGKTTPSGTRMMW
jgi:hypothetical protein